MSENLLVEAVIGIVSFIAGSFSWKRLRYVTLFINFTVLVIKMAHHYVHTAPNTNRINKDVAAKIDKMYHQDILAVDPNNPTGAAG